MSLNGILESFHTATARPEQVARQAKFMAASSAAFALSLLLMTRGRAYIVRVRLQDVLPTSQIAHKLAPTGDSRLATAAQLALAYTTEQALIYASCTAMLVRIGYAYAHARSHAAAHGQAGELSLAEIVPRAPVRHVVLAAGGALWFIATRAGDGLRGVAILLASGAIAGVTVLATMWVQGRGYC
jgi:oligosaccharide translocation protein RFT1